MQRLVLCTVYEARLADARLRRLTRVPLALIADRICGIALRYGADVIDLRRVCTEDDDSVAEIEPFARGALRIAGAIAASLRDEESVGRTRTIAT